MRGISANRNHHLISKVSVPILGHLDLLGRRCIGACGALGAKSIYVKGGPTSDIHKFLVVYLLPHLIIQGPISTTFIPSGRSMLRIIICDSSRELH